jgi:hypothetical protein
VNIVTVRRAHFDQNADAVERLMRDWKTPGMITSGSNDSVVAIGAKVAPFPFGVQDFSDQC